MFEPFEKGNLSDSGAGDSIVLLFEPDLLQSHDLKV